MHRTLIAAAMLVTFAIATPALAQEQQAPSGVDLSTRVEIGFLSPVYHKIQFGKDGSYIDYVNEGGQDVLFSFMRASVDVDIAKRHRITFLYQPLKLQSQVVLQRDLTIDGLVFNKGEAVDFVYGFPFYRVSYTYDLAPSDQNEVSLGASLQLRDATIVFTSVDGSKRRLERDVGPVPILKARLRHNFANHTWIESEIDGFYAPIKYINGGTTDVVGAIVDASVRYGFDVSKHLDAFVNLRYLGGGAEGTSKNPEFGDGYTKNWLHFATVSLGFTFDP